MPAPNMNGLRVRSNAFGLWKDKEKQDGRKITIDTIVEETGLAKLTVRRFLDSEQDVNGSTAGACAVIADYLGVSLGELLIVEKIADPEGGGR